MYKPPYMPLYVDDYEADTAHLSLEEDGVYNRLLRLCWRTAGCSLPDDPTWIARKMRVDLSTYHSLVEPIIKEFFRRENGRVFQGRQRREFDAAVDAYKKRAKAGAKGGRSRKTPENNENTPSNAEAMQKPGLSNQNQNHNHRKREANASPKRGSRLPPDWHLSALLRDWAIAQGLSEEEADFEADQFRDYWRAATGAKATKLDWDATWRTWVRNALKRKPSKQRSRADDRFARIMSHFSDDPAGSPEAEPGVGSGEGEGASRPLLPSRSFGG